MLRTLGPIALVSLASCASPRPTPPHEMAAPREPAAPPPAGPHGARDVLVFAGGDEARPAHVQLAGAEAVIALEPPALRMFDLAVPAPEGRTPPAPPAGGTPGSDRAGPALDAPPDSVVDRLLSTAAPDGVRVAVGLAGEGHTTRIVAPVGARTAKGLRPCGIAAAPEVIVLAERIPQPGSSSAELFLVRGKAGRVSLGQHAVGDLCTAAPRGAGGFLVAWMDVRGRLLVRPIDARGRAAGSTSAMPLPKGDRLVSPAMAPLPGGGAIVVGSSKKDGAVRGFLVTDRGRPRGGVLEIAPPHPAGPTGGAAVAPLPAGGFAVAWHASRLDREGAPTSLQLVFTDGEGRPTTAPMTVLERLALAPDPAAVSAAPGGAFVGAIVQREAGPAALVVHVPAPVPGAPAATPPAPSAPR